ncbi:MAG TPA: 30S ribosomal protein S20 [Patescibacteria group bacterium]|nr:30S ribosomal protein S20 [Patescibacteria group bacterium]
MPNTKSAKKQLRKDTKRSAQHLSVKEELKKTLKKARKAIEGGVKEEAAKLNQEAVKAIDKATKKKVIKKDTADRYKSRLQKKVNNLKK